MRLVNWNTEKTVFRECDGGNVMWECGGFNGLQAREREESGCGGDAWAEKGF